MDKRRDETPGYHHIGTRGNNKRRIFKDDVDRENFRRLAAHVAVKYGWTIIAYCLMDNHYHLVVRVGQKGLSKGMGELNTGYAVSFNRRHGRINHLFGRRFWNRRIKTDASLMATVRYVLQNPQRAGGRRALEACTWTSYPATLGLVVDTMAVAGEELLSFFGNTLAEARKALRSFCELPVRRPNSRRPP